MSETKTDGQVFPRLITPLEKYLNAPSTGGFIELLEGIRDGAIVLPDDIYDTLERASSAPHEVTTNSIFEFDRKLWQVLAEVDLEIYWGLISDRRSKKGDFAEPSDQLSVKGDGEAAVITPKISNELARLAGEAVSAQISHENSLKEARASTGNQLTFFADVNALFSDDKNFAKYRVKSLELENYLIGLCVTADALYRKTPCIRSDRDWRWIAQGVTAAYAAHLAALVPVEDDPDVKTEQVIAHGIALAQGSVFCLSAHVSGFSPNAIAFKKILEFEHGLPMSHALFAPYKYVPDYIERGRGSDIAWTVVKLALMVTMPSAYTSSEFWKFFIQSWTRNAYELNDSELREYADEIYFLNGIIALSSGDGDKFVQEYFLKRFYESLEKEIDGFDASRFLCRTKRLGLGDVPSIDLACFILREIRGSDRGGVDEGCTFVARRLVAKANARYSETGIPTVIPLLDDISRSYESKGFILKRSVYYQSLSTLALNLGEQEFSSEHFDEISSSECYTTATRLIAEDGHREHAAVFLSYALLRSFVVIPHECEPWSTRDLDRLVRSVIGQPFLGIYIVPMLSLILKTEFKEQNGRNVPTLSFRMWARSIVDEFEQKNRGELTLISGGLTELAPVKMPVWFIDGSDRLAESLQRLQLALSIPTPTEDQWRLMFRRHAVQDAVGEVLRQLEAQLKYFFSDVYYALKTNSKLNNAYTEASVLRAPLQYQSAEPTWGWIERLLEGVAKAPPSRDYSSRLENLRALANQALPGLGEVFVSVSRRHELVDALKKARELDNHFVSHNDAITPLERRQSVRGVVQRRQISRADTAWVFDYATVDFGQLFEAIKPIAIDEAE
jgi:hypothetical protein